MLYSRSLLAIHLIPTSMYEVEYYSAIKKRKIMPCAAWIDLQSAILSEVSWAEDKYLMISLICRI